MNQPPETVDARLERASAGLPKVRTGISGLDQITRGGIPEGRPTLVCGGPGCGKTALAMEFVCRGAVEFGEPGTFVSFEESRADIEKNFASSSFGMREALVQGTLHLESVLISREQTVETGDFTLDGLLARMERWVGRNGTRRLVLDSIDALFARFSDSANLRFEISRLFSWIRERGITAIVTAERGQAELTRRGLEEYASDCVILLDHRISDQISKRRIRIVKYRGSGHGADEYPFLIGATGVSVLPITALGLESVAPTSFVSSGIAGLDDMLAGKGFYRGSTVLISGAAGTGKSTLSARFAEYVSESGGRSLIIAFEESASQVVRNMRSVGIDLEKHVHSGALAIEAMRPSAFGLEEHLIRVHMLVDAFRPDAVIMDPITSFTSIGGRAEIKAMLIRLLDYLKGRGITIVMPSLTPGNGSDEETETEVSSMVDAWIIVHFVRDHGIRRRQMYVHKARGIGHSQAVGELIFSPSGISVAPFSPADGAPRGDHA